MGCWARGPAARTRSEKLRDQGELVETVKQESITSQLQALETQLYKKNEELEEVKAS